MNTSIQDPPTVDLAAIANQIAEEHAACCEASATALNHAIACGSLLAVAKVNVPHGEWSAWLADNFPASDRTARDYLRLAKFEGVIMAKRQHAADLTIRGALALIAKPRDTDKEPAPPTIATLLRNISATIETVEDRCPTDYRRPIAEYLRERADEIDDGDPVETALATLGRLEKRQQHAIYRQLGNAIGAHVLREKRDRKMARGDKPIRDWVPETLDTIFQLFQAIQTEAVPPQKRAWLRGADPELAQRCGAAANRIAMRAENLRTFFENIESPEVAEGGAS